MPPSRTRTARERARADVLSEIVRSARGHLAQDGAAALSLRAVARDLGMASSAVYRYVASRDELLTLLIVEAFDGLGRAAESAQACVERADLLGRWTAVCRAARGWALAHPYEYALVYGTPVPGYAAPQDTVGPATRVPTLLIGVLVDGVRSGAIDRSAAVAPAPATSAALGPLREVVPDVVDDELLLRGLAVWSHLFGAISFEVFGHLHNVVADEAELREAYFGEVVAGLADVVGLTGSRTARPGDAV